MSNKRIIKNSFFLYLLTFSNYFIGLLLYPYISRVLSVEIFGLVGFSMSYVLIFQVIVEFGFMISTTAYVAKNRLEYDKISKNISVTMSAKMILTIISVVLFLCSFFLVDMVKQNFMVVFLFFISAVVSAMLPDFYFRGVEKMDKITIRTVLVKVLSLVITFVFVKSDSDILIIPISMIIGGGIALIISLIQMKNEGVVYTKPSFKEVSDCLKEGFSFFMSRLAVSINSFLGAFFLGLTYLPKSLEMGFFSAATRLTSAGEMMIPPVVDSIYPHMVNKKDYKLLMKMLWIGTAILFVGCLVVALFAENICVLILGNGYVEAGVCLRILLIGVFFAYPNMMLGYTALSPIGKDNHANIAIMVSTVYCVLACVILWQLNSINLVSISIVIATRNIVSFIYRGTVFYKFKHLINQYK